MASWIWGEFFPSGLLHAHSHQAFFSNSTYRSELNINQSSYSHKGHRFSLSTCFRHPIAFALWHVSTGERWARISQTRVRRVTPMESSKRMAETQPRHATANVCPRASIHSPPQSRTSTASMTVIFAGRFSRSTRCLPGYHGVVPPSLLMRRFFALHRRNMNSWGFIGLGRMGWSLAILSGPLDSRL